MSQRPALTPSQAQAIQARFALKVTARLDHTTAQGFPHDIGERLRVARMQAVAGARAAAAPALAPQQAVTVLASPMLAGAGSGVGGQFQWVSDHGRAADHGRRLGEEPTGWGWRLASALPVLVLLAGLWGVGHWNDREQTLAAAEVDAALLSDELPPAAYVDPGFEEFLKSSADMPARQSTSTMSDDSLSDTPEAPRQDTPTGSASAGGTVPFSP